MKYEIDIFHYLGIYKKEWKRMAALIVIAMCINALMGYLQPRAYRSTAIVLSPKEGGGQVASFGGFINLTIGSSSNEIIFSMLKSARMHRDINEHFNVKDKPEFWWGLDTYIVTGGFAVEVKGPDPELTAEIANYAIENLDKINSELKITTQIPMVKVLDSAERGILIKTDKSKKVIATGLFVFMIYSLFIFFRGYFYQLKLSKNKRKDFNVPGYEIVEKEEGKQ